MPSLHPLCRRAGISFRHLHGGHFRAFLLLPFRDERARCEPCERQAPPTSQRVLACPSSGACLALLARGAHALAPAFFYRALLALAGVWGLSLHYPPAGSCLPGCLLWQGLRMACLCGNGDAGCARPQGGRIFPPRRVLAWNSAVEFSRFRTQYHPLPWPC